MRTIYRNNKVKQQFSDEHASRWKYPAEVVKWLFKINGLLNTAESFRDIAAFSPLHLERLKGKLKNRRKPTGEWSIRLGPRTGYRAILIPCDNQGQELTDGDVLAVAASITTVKVTEVTNHYE